MVIRNSLFGLTLIVAGCGGGGGSSTTPPVQTNISPIAVVSIDMDGPDEGQPFVINASASSDADNDPLTISITQVAGPTAVRLPSDAASPPANGIFRFTAPEVSEDKLMTFRASVSDGQITVSRDLDVTATNINLGPRSADWPIRQTLTVNHPIGKLRDVSKRSFNSRDITALINNNEGIALGFFEQVRDNTFTALRAIPISGPLSLDNAQIQEQILSAQFPTTLQSRYRDIAVLFEDESIIKMLQADTNVPVGFSEYATIEHDQVCDFAFIPLDSTGSPSAPDISGDLIVGSRTRGVEYYLNGVSQGNPGVFSGPFPLSPDASRCYVNAATFRRQTADNYLEIIALDPPTGEYDLLTVSDTLSVTKRGPFSLGIPAENGLEVIAVRADTDFIAYLMSNGTHIGDHRLLVYRRLINSGQTSSTSNQYRLTGVHQWQVGVPSGLYSGANSGNGIVHYVSLSTAPYVMHLVFDFRENSVAVDFIETELGASDVSFGATPTRGFNRLIVAFAEKQKLLLLRRF